MKINKLRLVSGILMVLTGLWGGAFVINALGGKSGYEFPAFGTASLIAVAGIFVISLAFGADDL